MLVEGASDETSMALILEKIFSSYQVKFLVVRGDITTRGNISVDNAVEKINKLICDEGKKYGYTKGDIKKIIHITDTDGAFVPDTAIRILNDEDVVENKEVAKDKIIYNTTYIACSDVKKIKSRNKQKSTVMHKLSTIKSISNIPYQIYYMSCNLEHVFHGELKDFSDDEKRDKAHIFAERYISCPESFIEFISTSDFAVQGNFKETWIHIRQGLNSLNRFSNLHLAFNIES